MTPKPSVFPSTIHDDDIFLFLHPKFLMPSHYPDEAISAQTAVEKVDGQWCVYVEVVFPDAIKRREVGCYYSEKKARVAAKWIEYGVNINWEDSSQDLE